eukprot:TRINITY_DN2083_c0_g1_i3.p3 TRINITY_DN2083_c0_g1~~TRINITY_DN2083_c0_g1_i3.p3  ORF type:complete len:138 (-),score=22.46 TRINITY_DN2083_c0_g1_i3:177-590(-)
MAVNMQTFTKLLLVFCISVSAVGLSFNPFFQTLETQFTNTFGSGFVFGQATDTGNQVDVPNKLTEVGLNVAKCNGVGCIANAGELEIRSGSRPEGGTREVVVTNIGPNNFAFCKPVDQCLSNDGRLVIYQNEIPGRG